MVDRRVRVDVVRDLERQQHLAVFDWMQQVLAFRTDKQLADLGAHVTARSHERVQRGLVGQRDRDARRDEVDHVIADADNDARRRATDARDAERKVLEWEVGPVGDRRPRVRHGAPRTTGRWGR